MITRAGLEALDLEALEAMAGPGARASVERAATGLLVRVAWVADGREYFYHHLIPGMGPAREHGNDLRILLGQLEEVVAESRRVEAC